MRTRRRSAPVERPVTLTIAGSDSGGGAGIQADVKTMEAFGAFATTAITNVTAQNTVGVSSSHPIPVEEIEAQLDVVFDDMDVQAVKTGMLGTRAIVETVTEYLADRSVPVVVDPVMVATSGDRLLEPEAEAAYEELIAESTVVTPNIDEVEVLTGTKPDTEAAATEAGERIVEDGANAALIKGGHMSGDTVIDVLVTRDDEYVFEHPRIETDATHGSGCTLSSAIAARLAHGDSLSDAVRTGVEFMERALRYPHDVGSGPGSVHHLSKIREMADRPSTAEAVDTIVGTLVDMNARPLVPEVGTNVVGATPYAESVEETAAVEGRITRLRNGIRPNRGVAFGASSHVARFLLAAREHDPDLRFAANLRFDDAVESALSVLDPVAEIDRSEEPRPDEEGATMQWAATTAFDRAGETPAAVFDRGDVGKEAMTRVLAPDPETLSERVRSLLEALPDDEH